MELAEAVTRRRMTRRFDPEELPVELLERLCRAALRAPTAGNTGGVDLLLLTSPARRAAFWSHAAEPSWLASPSSEAIRAAPAIVLPVGDPESYVARYARPDKAAGPLAGQPAAAWPVPYWHVDAAFTVMSLLLEAADAELGALFFQLHAGTEAVLAGLGLPQGRSLIGAVALGRPADDGASRPTAPTSRPRVARLHRERW